MARQELRILHVLTLLNKGKSRLRGGTEIELAESRLTRPVCRMSVREQALEKASDAAAPLTE